MIMSLIETSVFYTYKIKNAPILQNRSANSKREQALVHKMNLPILKITKLSSYSERFYLFKR